jgi:hypothetical protein
MTPAPVNAELPIELSRRVKGDGCAVAIPGAKWVDGSYRCSFCGKRCGKRLGRVKKLIAGPGVYICDRCVGLCSAILDKERTPTR